MCGQFFILTYCLASRDISFFLQILEMHSPSTCKPHSRHFVGNIILEFGISLSTVFSSCRQLPLLWIITFCLGPHIRGSVILYRIGYHQRKIITCVHLVAQHSRYKIVHWAKFWTLRNVFSQTSDPFYSRRGIWEYCSSSTRGIILSHIKDNMAIMIH